MSKLRVEPYGPGKVLVKYNNNSALMSVDLYNALIGKKNKYWSPDENEELNDNSEFEIMIETGTYIVGINDPFVKSVVTLEGLLDEMYPCLLDTLDDYYSPFHILPKVSLYLLLKTVPTTGTTIEWLNGIKKKLIDLIIEGEDGLTAIEKRELISEIKITVDTSLYYVVTEQ